MVPELSSAEAEAVGVRDVAGARFMMWLHNRNGSAPCVQPTVTLVLPFLVKLPLDGGGSGKCGWWTHDEGPGSRRCGGRT